jgi:hypothetical protein
MANLIVLANVAECFNAILLAFAAAGCGSISTYTAAPVLYLLFRINFLLFAALLRMPRRHQGSESGVN